MHTDITKAFKRYHLFGFTGTPIFADERRQPSWTTRCCARPSRRSATSCTPTRSSTPSTTRTSCRSASTTSTRSSVRGRRRQAGLGDRHRAGAPRCRSASASRRPTRWSTSTRRPSGTSYEHAVVANVRKRARASGEEASQRRRVRGFNSLFATASIDAASGTTPSSSSSRRICPRTAGSRSASSTRYARQRGSRRRASSTRKTSRPTRSTSRRATSSKTRSRTTTTSSAPASTPRRQVPELLQGPVAAAEEPRDRPGHRGQHVPDRLRRDDAEHAVRRQEPALSTA